MSDRDGPADVGPDETWTHVARGPYGAHLTLAARDPDDPDAVLVVGGVLTRRQAARMALELLVASRPSLRGWGRR